MFDWLILFSGGRERVAPVLVKSMTDRKTLAGLNVTRRIHRRLLPDEPGRFNGTVLSRPPENVFGKFAGM